MKKENDYEYYQTKRENPEILRKANKAARFKRFRRKLYLLIIIVVVVAAAIKYYSTVKAQIFEFFGEPTRYLGVEKCVDCHEEEYQGWLKTNHAFASDALDDNQINKPECLRCHTTGYGRLDGFRDFNSTPLMADIQCESCHGPGEAYINPLSSSKGHSEAGKVFKESLVMPKEKDCRKCHDCKIFDCPGCKTFEYQHYLEEGIH